jgi:diguanylate cyclase (GGDEF)-like protein
MERTLAVIAVGLAAVVGYGLVLFGLDAEGPLYLALADLGQVAAGLAAGLTCLLAARRQATGRARRSWGLLGLGLLSYAAGDAYWTWAEVVVGEAPGVPSWADLGYLAMVPLALAGIIARPIQRPRDINRLLLLRDAGVALSGLCALAWVLVLQPLFAGLDTDPLVRAVTLAYPLGDVALLFCLVVLILREARTRAASVAVVAGWAAMALADAAYLVLVARNAYATGHPVDLVWFAALVLVAVGAACEPRLPVMTARVAPDIGHPWRFLAPSALVAVGGVVVWAWPFLREGRLPEVDQAALALAWALLLARVVVGYRDTALAHRLEQTRRREAQDAALRDPLTGLANRRAFEAALDEMARRAADGDGTFGLALVDFDLFKQFNDTYGHTIGDDALQELADVLRQEAGPSGFVARIGGDEFAVLLPMAGTSALTHQLAKIQSALWVHPRVRASVGGVGWQPDLTPRDLLQAADRDLYAAKRDRPPPPWSSGRLGEYVGTVGVA